MPRLAADLKIRAKYKNDLGLIVRSPELRRRLLDVGYRRRTQARAGREDSNIPT